ncbi:hypothetical protein A2W24_05440 [Microgenomates group bacterium RBG_16_45_19]|nr:MAG: hypothetical protein A2W24_05440 [Microgenomates group bacterium RBG_16_45_19]
MNLLFISTTYLPTINGVSYYQHFLAQALRRLGHTVYLYAPRHPRAKPDPFVIRYPAVITPFVYDYPLSLPPFHLHLLDRLDLDLVHIHHPFTVGTCALKLKRTRGLPFIFTHHTQYHQYLQTNFPLFPRLTAHLINRHLFTLAQAAHAVICPTPSVQRQLQALGLTNTVQLPNGINLAPFSPQTKPAPPPWRLIFIGRLEKEKQPHQLLALAQNLRAHHFPFHLTLVGAGRLLPSLQQQIRELSLQSLVTCTGPLTYRHIARLLPRQHLFVSFSTTEVMPLSYLEALACGVPLALVQTNCLPRFTAAAIGLALPQDPAAAATYLIRLFHDPTRYRRLVKSTPTYASGFSLDHSAHQLLKLYREAVKSAVV